MLANQTKIVKALQLGVKGYLLKQDYRSLTQSLRAALNGQSVFGGAVVDRLPVLMREERNPFDYRSRGITDREYALIQLVAEGDSNREIADRLFLSEGTVRNYLSQILEKLNLDIPVCGMVKDDHHRTASLMNQYGEILPVDPSEELFFLLTRMQDEVHRFAISYHRDLRSG